MDSSKKMKRPNHPRPTELATITRQYNSLLWRFKGAQASISNIKYALPKQLGLIDKPLTSNPGHTKAKLTNALVHAENALDYCEYLLRELSADHRAVLKYTTKTNQHNNSIEGG